MSNNLDIRIVAGLSPDGIPFPAEEFDPVRLTDPEEFRELLGAQELARRVLPCIDTRAAYWRYYLFGAPAEHGRFLASGRRLLRILKQTESRGGIGRRDFPSFWEDGRRSEGRFVESLRERFKSYYGTVMGVFWGTDDDLPSVYPGPPSEALCDAAREYIVAEDYADFFSDEPSRLRYMFHARLVNFRPGLASFLQRKGCDLEQAAAGAASSSKLEDDERLLFFAWAVLQAYYGIADDGTDPDAGGSEEDVDGEELADENRYYRTLAKAALDLMERHEGDLGLSKKQLNVVRNRLWTARQQKGAYEPPVRVWRLKNDGRRRRIFVSLRLRRYVQLLSSTGG